jgi:hypothetical protein
MQNKPVTTKDTRYHEGKLPKRILWFSSCRFVPFVVIRGLATPKSNYTGIRLWIKIRGDERGVGIPEEARFQPCNLSVDYWSRPEKPGRAKKANHIRPGGQG